MDNVRMEYLYRDASNYKAYAPPLIMAGPATEADLARIRAALDVDGLFICEQVGLPPAEFETGAFGLYEDDHAWHELSVLELTNAAPNTPITFADIQLRFASVGEWNSEYGRQVDPEVVAEAARQRAADDGIDL